MAAIVVFFAFGIEYWRHYPGLSWRLWQDCAYGDSSCSMAAATWALGSFALLSFLAAARAVVWTRKLFEIEVQLKLGQTECVNHSELHINKDIFITRESQVLIGSRPAGFTKDQLGEYYDHHAGFTNLGRTALADVGVKVCFVDQNNVRSGLYPVKLGSIRCDDEIHVVIYISKFFHDMTVLWGDATEQGQSLSLFAVNALLAPATFALPSTQLLLPAMARVDAGQAEAPADGGPGAEAGGPPPK
ncbi:MAG: hypothetical protein WB681_08475 [Candidatus Cybelea sp.]